MSKYFAQNVYVTTTAMRRGDQHQNQISSNSNSTHHQSHHRANRNTTSANNTSSCDSIVADGSDDDTDNNYILNNSSVDSNEVGSLSTSSIINANGSSINSGGGGSVANSNKMHQQKISSHLLDHGYGATPQSYYPKESKVIPKTSSDGGCITNYYKVSFDYDREINEFILCYFILMSLFCLFYFCEGCETSLINDVTSEYKHVTYTSQTNEAIKSCTQL